MCETLLSLLHTINYSILIKAYEVGANINAISQTGRRLKYSKCKELAPEETLGEWS